MNFKAATPRFVDLRQGRRVIFEKKMKK